MKRVIRFLQGRELVVFCSSSATTASTDAGAEQLQAVLTLAFRAFHAVRTRAPGCKPAR